MLVHKRTLGALQWYWDGVSYVTVQGTVRPRMAPVTLETYGLDEAEWWQVPNGTPLARRIALHYPFFDPVVAEDRLVDIRPWPAWRRYGEQAPPPEPAAAPRPGRRPARRYNRRRTGI